MNSIISPSILAGDFYDLKKDIQMINKSEADWLHLDIMDGVFVPNISFGFSVMDAIADKVKKPLDVHLMIEHPEKFIPQIKATGAKIMNVHYEACLHLNRVIHEIQEAGMKPAVTLNPSTPVCMLQDVINDVFMVLIMTVNPGFGGQKFITHSIEKIKELKQLIIRSGSDALIEVDGGITLANAILVKESGADALVAGSAIFHAANPIAAIHELKII